MKMFLKPHVYAQRLKSGANIHEVVPDFVNDLMNNYDLAEAGQIADFFLEADKIGKSIAYYSDGIQQYYKLVPNWVQIMLAQLALFGAEETGGKEERERISEKFRDLCRSFEWDAEEALKPKHDATRTVMKFMYQSENGQIIFNMILECSLKWKIGQKVLSPNGDLYIVNIPASNGDTMLECWITGRIIPFTEYMLRGFTFAEKEQVQ